MPLYRVTFFLKPESNEEQRDLVLKKLKDIIIAENGKIKNIDSKGMQKLAYEVDKVKEGFFISADFEVDSSKISQIHKFLLKEEEIIRVMVTKQKISSKKKDKGGDENEWVKSGSSNRESHPGS